LKKRSSYEEIKNFIEESGFKIATKDYKNQKQVLELICPAGHEIRMNFNNFRYRTDRCVYCKGKYIRMTKEDVIDWFNHWGCTLITTDYLNQDQLISYFCKCGKEMKNTMKRLKRSCKDPYCLECRRKDAKEQKRRDAEELMKKIWF